MKYFVTIVVLLLGIFFLLSVFGESSTNVIDDPKTYSANWDDPNSQQLSSISRLLSANNVSGCGEYKIKEITQEEYVIACSSDGYSWTYYVAYPAIGKLYLANDEMKNKLSAPNSRR